jgi:serine/threonine-protein kinase
LQAALGDDYQLERELGGGGMSRVFVATERRLARRVAVKVLPPELGAGVNVERFRREIQLAASLQHPHIVPLLTAGEGGGLLYYTMPFIEGETLRQRLTRQQRLEVQDAARILRGVLEALSYAHRRGIVHRDVKPENVLIVDEHALVSDFGVSKALTQATDGAALTTAGIALGTPAYMAPEQAAGDPDIDHRSDIYAAGVVGYEMLSGRTPFGGQAVPRVLAAQVMQRPEHVTRIRPEVPPALAATVMRCLEKDPAKRWQSADELKRELEQVATVSRAAVPGRRRMPAIAVGIAVVTALVAGTIWRVRTPAGAAASPTLVAVLPFAVRGGPDLTYLGEGLVNLLSTSLDGAGNLRAVDPHAVLSTVRHPEQGALDPDGGARAAERLGAGMYVLGDIVEAGDRLRIGASLYDREHGSLPQAFASIEGVRAELFALVDGLATQLLGQASSGPTGRVTRIASVTTPSLAAYKAYLDGEAALRAGRADSAVIALEQATTLDTAFALAYYRLSVAAEWATRAPLAARAAEQAVRHSARLAEHDRLLLKALLATRRGAAVEAEALYRDILGTYADDLEAWIQLGEVLFHYGPWMGRPVADARVPFERVLYFEPANVSAMVHLARIAALEHRTDAVDSLVGLILRYSPSNDRALEMRVLRAYATRDAAQQQRLQPDIARASDALFNIGIWDVAAYVGDLDGAVALTQVLADPSRSRDARAAGHTTLAYLALTRGKVDTARVEIQRAAAADSVRALEYGTLLELVPFLEPRRNVLAEARRKLERLDATAIPPSAMAVVFYNAHDGVHPILRSYLLGLVNVRLGDLTAAARDASTLSQMKGPPTAAALPRDLGLEIRAEIALAQGAPGTALALLRQRSGESWYEYHMASPVFAGSRARYLTAVLLAAQAKGTEDIREAIRLFSSFESYSPFDIAYAAPARRQRAALYERLGDRTAAAADYAHFVELWKDCDAGLRTMVDSARAKGS